MRLQESYRWYQLGHPVLVKLFFSRFIFSPLSKMQDTVIYNAFKQKIILEQVII